MTFSYKQLKVKTTDYWIVIYFWNIRSGVGGLIIELFISKWAVRKIQTSFVRFSIIIFSRFTFSHFNFSIQTRILSIWFRKAVHVHFFAYNMWRPFREKIVINWMDFVSMRKSFCGASQTAPFCLMRFIHICLRIEKCKRGNVHILINRIIMLRRKVYYCITFWGQQSNPLFLRNRRQKSKSND